MKLLENEDSERSQERILEEDTIATMQLILPTILLAACTSAEIAPWHAEPYTTSNQGYNGGEGYQSGQGGQGGQVAFHAQRASPYSRKGSPITFERSDEASIVF